MCDIRGIMLRKKKMKEEGKEESMEVLKGKEREGNERKQGRRVKEKREGGERNAVMTLNNCVIILSIL